MTSIYTSQSPGGVFVLLCRAVAVKINKIFYCGIISNIKCKNGFYFSHNEIKHIRLKNLDYADIIAYSENNRVKHHY